MIALFLEILGIGQFFVFPQFLVDK
jgi:hypothetical protein